LPNETGGPDGQLNGAPVPLVPGPPTGQPLPPPAPGGAPTGNVRIGSTDGVELEAHLAEPDAEAGNEVLARPGVIFLHSFPSGDVWADLIGADLPELADRTAQQLGFVALSIRFRGCGSSTGHFSLQGWVDDVAAAVEYLATTQSPNGIWLCGFGTGGAVGLVAAADDGRVKGIALAGSPADFDDWAANPNRLMAHARRVGAIQASDFPSDAEAWRSELRRIRAVSAAEHFSDRPMLVVHGSDDEAVPHFDARALGDAHGLAEMRFIRGAGHLLRHDPRAVAMVLGWLVRQQGADSPVTPDR
jgi:uncharacterized protein